MKNSICHIFAAGELFSPPDTRGGFVIAADGGYAHVSALGIAPNLIIGDFDSLGYVPDGAEVIKLPEMKDETDTAAALRIGWERGFRVFHIYGGTGGRIDHTLANIQCIADIARSGGRAFLHDNGTILTAAAPGSIRFSRESRGVISVFAHTDRVSGVYERGLKYSLNNALLESHTPLGVSNEFIGKEAEISFSSGILVIVYSDGTVEV